MSTYDILENLAISYVRLDIQSALQVFMAMTACLHHTGTVCISWHGYVPTLMCALPLIGDFIEYSESLCCHRKVGDTPLKWTSVSQLFEKMFEDM